MFKQAYEQAITHIEANRQRQIEIAKQKTMQEQIVPFNTEIDVSLREAIAELQNQHNEKIMQLQQAFEAEKKALTEAAAKKKSDFAESSIASAVHLINIDADKAISHLKSFIEKQGA